MATDSSQLPTVLLSVRAWRESPGREELMLQLSVEPENARDFRLSVRRLEAARGLGSTIAEFKLKDVNYTTRCSRSHELSVPGKPGCPMIFHFESEHDALQWWNVVSSCLREVLKAAQNHGSVLLNKHVASSSPVKGLSIDAVPAMTLADMPTKEDLAVRLGRAIETGDQQLAAQCALVLTKQKVPLQIQLKQNCYPKTEICMKVGVEDASGSANISINVQAHTTIALLKQQMFQDYQFHPSVQRWIIGQCLCLDDRTVGSYGIKKDGDTAFLYLLSAKQAKLNVQDQYLSYQNPSLFTSPSLMGETKFHTLPPRPPPKNVAQKKRRNDEGQIVDLVNVVQNLHLEIDKLSKNSRPPLPAAPPSPAQPGWPCPVCTYINKPTRPGCEMCSTERPLDYVIPVQYTPDEIERRRLQQEQESLQQYNQGKRREKKPSSHQDQSSHSLDEFVHLSAEFS